MSQQAQAEDLQGKALQAEAEIKAKAVVNFDEFLAGKRSKEEYETEKERLTSHFEATDHFVTEAAKLNTIRDRAVTLASAATAADAASQPKLLRPLGSVSDDAADDDPRELNAAIRDDLSKYIEALARLQVPPHHYNAENLPLLARGSEERALLNAYLRPERTDLTQACKVKRELLANKEAMEKLHAPRRQFLMNSYVDRDGGFVTAEEMRNEMISLRTKEVGIISRARTISTTAATVTFPTSAIVFDYQKRDRTGQGAVTQLRLTDVFGKTRFMPAGRDIILLVPEELVEDVTFDLVGFIAEEANRVSTEEDEKLMIEGSGAGEPLGYLTGLVKLFDEGATTIGIDPDGTDVPTFFEAEFNPELIQVFDTFMISNARTNAVWTGPRIFERRVRLFREKPGGDETGNFLFKRALEAGAPNTLNGFPLLTSEFFPDKITSGVVGDVLFHFGDLRDYWWVVRTGLRVRVLNELFAGTSEVGFKYDKRQDGALVRADANIFARRQADAP